jgi:hypothetical protein
VSAITESGSLTANLPTSAAPLDTSGHFTVTVIAGTTYQMSGDLDFSPAGAGRLSISLTLPQVDRDETLVVIFD